MVALRNVTQLDVPLVRALGMVISVPAKVIGRDGDLGHLLPGNSADFIHLDAGLNLSGVWRAGVAIENT
jgi:N-acetylglucosamine-6-phosphate deacetylase